MALNVFGKLVSSISERNSVRHAAMSTGKSKIVKIRANFRGAVPAPFMGKFHLVRCKRKIMT